MPLWVNLLFGTNVIPADERPYLTGGISLDFQPPHNWPESEKEALQIQHQFRKKVVIEDCFDKIELITSIDTAYDNKRNRLYSAVVTMTYPEMAVIEKVVAEGKVRFPYIPAFLAFREGPVVLKSLSRLKQVPDLLIFAGHGIAHPRKFGMASHIGLITDFPSIGCSRKVLIGDFEMPGEKKGSSSQLILNDETVGRVYRTKEAVKPMFISSGHRCSLDTAVEIIVNCLTTFRMPEPLRLAHLYAGKFKRSSGRKYKNNKISNQKSPSNMKHRRKTED
jgi:deoxyribonuclease V